MIEPVLKRLDLDQVLAGAGTGGWRQAHGGAIESVSPIHGQVIGRIQAADHTDYESVVRQAQDAFKEWRRVPAPRRGDIVRQLGNALRDHKDDLGALISLEVGKIRQEGEGEVQEMIDICDFAVGQARMLYGLAMHSERPSHRLYEQWHPLGPIGVITAFNFPLAVWSWNAMIALVAGDAIIWKPSCKAALCALAVLNILWPILKDNDLPDGLLSVLIGPRDAIGTRLLHDRRIPLISATGSVRMGQTVARAVGERLGRTILELGGNNAIIVTPKADLEIAIRSILFGAVGTAGQRCTTTRRVIIHTAIYEDLKKGLIKAYQQIPIGNPLEQHILMGPLIDQQAVADMQAALAQLRNQGGHILYGGETLSGPAYAAGTYVSPCLCEARPDMPIVAQETFAPLLYLMTYDTIEQAIAYHNAVPQGLSSSIITQDLLEAETFLSHAGSDCGIANVNMGTSGAEIGGAFGGEKDTGGGREAGSDAWKAYMRRQTCAINWSRQLPLAQGIRFELQ